MGKLLSFPRRHPALSVIGVAGAGLLAGPELALGVVLGAGVAVLVHRRAEGRSEGRSEGGVESRIKHVEKDAVEAARSVRQRAREIFGAKTVKQRARAVVQAARGQISPVPTHTNEAHGGQTSQAPPPAGESQRQPANEISGPPPM
ncbi:MAG TPA: hypothetical protein VF469_27590 [Kofleriaceae bacterium]